MKTNKVTITSDKTNKVTTTSDKNVSQQCLVSTHKYGDPPTVAEVIERLKEMPQHLRCYFRPKYHGAMDYVDEIPLHYLGICEMEPEGRPRQVTFLC
jgi:hypothetical protein